MEESIEKPVRKIPLERRFRSKEMKQQLEHLKAYAKTVEEKLREAFGTAPDQLQIDDATNQVRETLITIAKDASVFARQYRDFNVGAVVIGLRKTAFPHENPWTVMFDANTKPKSSDKKWCAEQYLMDRMTGMRLQKVLAFVVVGKPQIDNDSNVEQVTLTPCKMCRDRMMLKSEETDPVITSETEVITADLRDPRFRKYQKVGDLQRFHRELPPGYLEID